MNNKLIKYAIIHSVGVAAYVSLVVTFMSNSQRLFGKGDNAMIGVVMLLLLVLSALVTGSLVLGKPIMMYLDGQKKEAVKLLLFTAACLFVLLLLAIGVMVLLK